MLVVLGSCSTDSDSIRDAPATTQVEQGVAEAEIALGRYVDAINQGDTAAAMDLRCAGARVADPSLGAFERDAAALIEDIGPLRIAAVETASEVAPVEGLLQYTIAGHEGALTIAESDDGGFCFWRPAVSYELERDIADPIDLGNVAVPPQQLLPSSVGEGYDVVPTPDSGGSSSTATATISRSWVPKSFGGVTVTVGTYPDSNAVLADAARFLDDAVANGVAAVDLGTSPGVRGVRSLGYAWLWVQPPSVGPFIDVAVLPFGRLLVTVQVSGRDAATVDAQLAEVTAEVFARARPVG